ncbi:DUF6058 family natural product biosynthesis protein [Kangiella shandongensis]|uniref:DUF6058 family natural product biosynthesis protein n=1 Tax=Kangiella shandongensis TaxID=2763258 RepID=UPI001CBF4C20|nr:DUF6058 family natural product biosynthesis protein [Kangiella shandongensis]
MELIHYLNSHFFTLQELLDNTKITEQDFRDYQDNEVMPKASYKLDVDVRSDSFFGLHEETHCIEYYAKGYASWLGIVHSLNDSELIYDVFSTRYEKAIAELKSAHHLSSDPKINANLAKHIREEWQHFIQGIYGLCTVSGLPEDIAAKEFAILQINELSSQDKLTDDEMSQLERAVNLLDKASSAFAPHERQRSSRYRLVDETRRKFKLKS